MSKAVISITGFNTQADRERIAVPLENVLKPLLGEVELEWHTQRLNRPVFTGSLAAEKIPSAATAIRGVVGMNCTLNFSPL